jgi:hypothetical protein
VRALPLIAAVTYCAPPNAYRTSLRHSPGNPASVSHRASTRWSPPSPSLTTARFPGGTIDCLEERGYLHENVSDNLFGPVVLARLAEQRGKHSSYLVSVCIFTYEEGDQGFGKESKLNFFRSQYSVAKDSLTT